MPRHPHPVRPAVRGRQAGQWMRRFHQAARAMALAAGLGLASAAHAVDVNSASAEQLETLRGIGPKTAQMILQERARSGPFLSLQDFTERIRGIGPKRAAALQAAGLRVGGGESTGAAIPRSAAAPIPRQAWSEPVITEVAPFDR
nr:DUF655 domain-containing protein [Verticiella sp. GG226]